MRLTWWGHSAFRVETGRSVIMIDPFLSGSPVFESTVEEASRGTTHVLLTHGHDDHTGDAAAICKATGATLIAVHEICMHLMGQGVDNIDPGNTGGTIYSEDFDVTFVRADHSSSTGSGVYLGNPCGLVIRAKAEEQTLYHMGDTDIFGDMALIDEIHKPDFGIVPIGDRFTMSPRTAALACKRYFDFSAIFPCHYRTFPLLAPSAEGFVEAMGEDARKVKVLDVGETVTL